jgi:Ser/Thr protein kinase RdoA (MazF antagonist)
MTTDLETPYADLSPDLVLDAVESVGGIADGRLIALNSYENRVYQVGLEGAPAVVAKFYRPGRWSDAAIAEEHAFALALAECEIPVVAPLRYEGRSLHRFGGHRFALAPRQGGRPPELDQPKVLERIGRFIGRIHTLGAARAYRHRPTLDLVSFGEQPRAYLLDHGWIPADLEQAWRSVTAHALEGVRACFARAGEVRQLRLHGDCHASNILWSDDGPHFVDLDDTRMGPAIQDLWLLLSGSREEMALQLGELLAGYEDFCQLDMRELHLVEALRTLRIIHFAGWLARRWHDPAFPAAFPWFDTHRYWEEQVLQLREQIAAMQEGPLWIG